MKEIREVDETTKILKDVQNEDSPTMTKKLRDMLKAIDERREADFQTMFNETMDQLAIVESVARCLCDKHGVWYRLPDGREVQDEEVRAWFLQQGVDVEDEEWVGWLDFLEGYDHCWEPAGDIKDEDFDAILDEMFEDEADFDPRAELPEGAQKVLNVRPTPKER